LTPARELEGGSIWINGRLVGAADAHISALDHGVTVGDGVFETMKIVRDEPFAFGRHLARLRRSAGGIRLIVPYDDATLRQAVHDVLEASPGAGRVRMTLTGGPGPLGSGRAEVPATVIVAAADPHAWDPSASVAVVPWRRNEHGAVAGLKTTSYAENVVALDYAAERGADEAIFANTAGNLCEGTGTNIFVGIDGELVTPPLSSGCLAGITRELVVELVPVAERDLPVEALADAEEAFLTSSTRDVQPVRSVDDVALPHCPGPLTEHAASAFADLVGQNLDP
jgi:branched-chain amino acid aminotransferase